MTQNKKRITKKAITVLAATAMVTSVVNVPLTTFASEVTAKPATQKTISKTSASINAIGDVIGPDLLNHDASRTDGRFNNFYTGLAYTNTPNPAKSSQLANTGNWFYIPGSQYAKFSGSDPFTIFIHDLASGIANGTGVSEQVITTVPGKWYRFDYTYRLSTSYSKATDEVGRYTLSASEYGKDIYDSKTYTLSATDSSIPGDGFIEFQAKSTKTIISGQLSLGKLVNDGSQHYVRLTASSVKEIVTVPEPVTINRITNHDNAVTGHALPNAEVVVETNYQVAGNTMKRVYTTTANDTGEFTVPIPTQIVGSKIAAKQIYQEFESELAVANVMDADLYTTPIVDPINSLQTKLTGTATLGATVNVRIGEESYTASVNEDGTYTVNFDKAYATGTEMTITLSGPNEKVSAPVTITVGKSPLEQATEAVDNLFTDQTHTVLADGVNQDSIDAAQALVDALPASTIKTELQRDIDNAQKLLDAKLEEEQREAAQEALDALFTDATHTEIAPETTQEAIDAVQELISALPNGSSKDELQRELDKAQALLDAKIAEAKIKAAQEAVDRLFEDETHSELAEGVTQDLINKVKEDVDALPAGPEKEKLLEEVKKAEDLLKEQSAIGVPTIATYTEKEAFVTGTVGKNTAYVGLFVDGIRVKLATPDTDGNYRIAATGFALSAGKVFEVRAYGVGNVAGPSAQATVQAAAGAEYNLTASDVALDSDYITGEIGSGMNIVKLSVDGVIVKIGQITGGTYKIAAKGLIKSGSVVQVVGYHDRNEIKRVNVKVLSGEKVKLTAMSTQDDVLRGSVTPGSAMRVRISINGVAVKTASIQADGTFTSSIGKQVAGAVIKVEVYEADGYNEARSNTITVLGEEASSLPTPVIDSQEGDYVIGTVTNEAAVVVLYEDGVAKRTAAASGMTANPDGTLSFKIYVTKGTKQVQVMARNADKTKVSNLSEAFQIK
ncbi:hypothetical protein HB847_04015 [Listeria booriae]|uniref:Bacterial Ig domain-containing protein n=1 Tax=Listeria booriae TaxID=1552123 RepID=A0A841Y5I2_9LIST|nr:toxin Cry1Ac domain D-VI-related protein [Listeria booriae]MBC1371525.1 hypothetical protein [Listeria booriae]